MLMNLKDYVNEVLESLKGTTKEVELTLNVTSQGGIVCVDPTGKCLNYIKFTVILK